MKLTSLHCMVHFPSFLNLKNHSFSAYFSFHHITLHVHKLRLNYEFNIKINEAYCVLNTLENTPLPSIIIQRLPSETNLNMISLCLKLHNFYQLILRV